MKIFYKHISFIIIFFISNFLFLSCSGNNQRSYLNVIQGSTMGTTYTIKIVKDESNNSGLVYENLKPGINKLLEEINRQMSTWREDSEITQFNNYSKSDWFPVSKDFAFVMQGALNLCEMSNGVFDITVGRLVNLWGFGPGNKESEIPGDDSIKTKMKLVGCDNIVVKTIPPSIKKELPEVYCDLSGIAKGFGVDKIAEHLDSLQITNYLIEIGGELYAKGRNHLDEDWKIGISTPDTEFGLQKVVSLKDFSIATSGDYRNYFEKNGVRYSHTIDPRTGKPITHKLVSVSVITKSCMTADGLATAITVLGPEEGYKFALKENLSVFMIVKEDEGFKELMTPEFEEILSEIRE